MVQGLSLSTLTASRNSGVCGPTLSWRKHFKLMKKTYITSANERHCVWHQCVKSMFLKGNPSILRQRDMRVEAGWLFKGGDQELDASSEKSETANEDILIFFFQLDLATRVQVWLGLNLVGLFFGFSLLYTLKLIKCCSIICQFDIWWGFCCSGRVLTVCSKHGTVWNCTTTEKQTDWG